jgi:hypothetical protein
LLSEPQLCTTSRAVYCPGFRKIRCLCSVQQINRDIELIRYRRFADELLLFELVNAAIGGSNGTLQKKRLMLYLHLNPARLDLLLPSHAMQAAAPAGYWGF